MRYRYSLISMLVAAALSACNGDSRTTAPNPPPPPPPPPPPSVLLRDVVIPNLPSPYYHFEYDASGRISTVSFASDLRTYQVMYDGSRISEMKSVGANHDQLQYEYDDAGQVSLIKYVDSNGVVFTTVEFFYAGPQLTKVERSRKVDGGYIVDKTMTMSYYPDGNVEDVTEHLPVIDGRPAATTTVDHYEQYDDKINVDGFSLIHDEFFDHLVLLPGVQIQKGNAARLTHTGDGLNFQVDYTYTYDDKNRPLTKNGQATVFSGSGQQVYPISSAFTYY